MTVFENEHLTFKGVSDQAIRAAGMLRDRYGVRKSDKLATVSRNYQEWIVAFWATQLLGGVYVCVNAWLPTQPLHHDITLAHSKGAILDAERAAKIDQQHLHSVSRNETFLVFRPHEAMKYVHLNME